MVITYDEIFRKETEKSRICGCNSCSGKYRKFRYLFSKYHMRKNFLSCINIDYAYSFSILAWFFCYLPLPYSIYKSVIPFDSLKATAPAGYTQSLLQYVNSLFVPSRHLCMYIVCLQTVSDISWVNQNTVKMEDSLESNLLNALNTFRYLAKLRWCTLS